MINSISQLEKLKTQQVKLAARIQSLESRTKIEERKKDTRRKILIGSYYLDQANQKGKMGELKQCMENYLKRNQDRKLFDLTEITEPTQGMVENK